MNLDLLIAGLLAVFGLLGLASGAIKQLTHWAALAMAYIAAGPLAGQLTPVLAPRLGLPPVAVKIASPRWGFSPSMLSASSFSTSRWRNWPAIGRMGVGITPEALCSGWVKAP